MTKTKDTLIQRQSPQLTMENILAFIGVTRENTRKDAYDHWKRFIQLVKRRSGYSWHNDIRPKLRSWLGIDYRYIDAYLDACLSWGIMEMKNGQLSFVGIPDDADIPTELDREQLEDELHDENYQRLKLGKPALSLEEWKRQRKIRQRPIS